MWKHSKSMHLDLSGVCGKEPAYQYRRPRDIKDTRSNPGLGRSPGEGHGNPLQYSCLENSMDRGACQAIVHRVTKRRTQLKALSMKPVWLQRTCSKLWTQTYLWEVPFFSMILQLGSHWVSKCSRSVVSDSLHPHGPWPIWFLHPWDFPGKSTGVGCHCLLQKYLLGCIYSCVSLYQVHTC